MINKSPFTYTYLSTGVAFNGTTLQRRSYNLKNANEGQTVCARGKNVRDGSLAAIQPINLLGILESRLAAGDNVELVVHQFQGFVHSHSDRHRALLRFLQTNTNQEFKNQSNVKCLSTKNTKLIS